MPPSPNRIKIYVNSSFSSTAGVSSIRGIFRDHLGSVLLQFAKHIEVISSVHAKILAIREDILIAVASRWSNSMPFEIKSDSANAVSWFSNPASAPWRFQNIIKETMTCFARQIVWSISHTRRSGNKVADIFACVGASSFDFIDFV